MIDIVVLYALLASTFTIGKVVLAYTTPFFLIAFRMLVAAVVLLGYYRFIKKRVGLEVSRDWPLFASAVLLYIYIPYVFEFWALKYVSSIKANMIFSASPFVSALFAYLLYNHRLTGWQCISLVVGFFGLLPLLLCTSASECKEQTGKLIFVLADAALVVAMVASSYAWFLVKELMRKKHSLLVINGVTMAGGGFLTLATSIGIDVLLAYSRSEPIVLVSNIPLFLLGAGALTLIGNIILYPLYGLLLQKYSVTFLSFCGFLSPVFGAFFGWLFINEQVTWYHLFSLLVIAAALALFYQQERKQYTVEKW